MCHSETIISPATLCLQYYKSEAKPNTRACYSALLCYLMLLLCWSAPSRSSLWRCSL